MGVYVYGIMPSDIEVASGGIGVGDPPGEIRVVRHGDLAALVSDVDLSQPLGRPEDLYAHEELPDSSAAAVPVLPLRFGAIVTSDDVVAEELLGAHHDEFAAALRQLEGHAEYVVRGRYVEDAILREVLAENPRVAQLAERIQGEDQSATANLRMELGEIVSNAIAAKREQDIRAVGHAVRDVVADSVVRQPTHELDAACTAFLVRTDRAPELEAALERVARGWRGRVELRLIGPQAAYDFVGTAAPATGG
jgi:hypothetical protein